MIHGLYHFQLLPEYQVSHERAVYKTVAIVADTKKIVQNIDLDSMAELRAMQKPNADIEDLMAAVIMLCEYLSLMQSVTRLSCHFLMHPYSEESSS